MIGGASYSEALGGTSFIFMVTWSYVDALKCRSIRSMGKSGLRAEEVLLGVSASDRWRWTKTTITFSDEEIDIGKFLGKGFPNNFLSPMDTDGNFKGVFNLVSWLHPFSGLRRKKVLLRGPWDGCGASACPGKNYLGKPPGILGCWGQRRQLLLR